MNIANVEKKKKKGDDRIGGFMVLAEGEFNQFYAQVLGSRKHTIYHLMCLQIPFQG